MSLDILFEKIRKEEVVLWIGAGFSLDAGYPSGKKLSEIIAKECVKYGNDFSIDELKFKNLDDISEILVRNCNGSKNTLITLLKNQFASRSEKSITHEILSRIPHFNHIITTNFDTLIEDNYQGRANVVRDDKDLTYLQKQYPTIYKIHGDILSLDKIVISRNDYNNIDFNSPIINHIKSLVTTKDVLFIGYSYEDAYMWKIFENIENSVGNHKRQKFILFPFEGKTNERLIREGFHAINLSGEKFIYDLDENIKSTIKKDVLENWTEVNTYYKYIEHRNLNSEIENIENKKYIKSIKDKEGKSDLKIDLIMTNSAGKKLMNFESGKSNSLEFILKSKDLIKLEITNFGIKDTLNESNISELRVQVNPIFETIDIVRDKSGLSFYKAPVKKYVLKKKIIYKGIIGDYDFVLTLNRKEKIIDTNFLINYKTEVNNLEENIKFLKLFNEIGDNNLILIKLEKISIPFKFYVDNFTKDTKYEFTISMFNLLSKIQFIAEKSNIRFEKFSLKSVSLEIENTINFLYEILKDGILKETNTDRAVLLKEDNLFSDKLLGDFAEFEDVYNVLILEEMIIPLFDSEINIGFLLLRILNPEIIEHKEKRYITSKTKEIIFMTKKNKEDYFKKDI